MSTGGIVHEFVQISYFWFGIYLVSVDGWFLFKNIFEHNNLSFNLILTHTFTDLQIAVTYIGTIGR